MSQSSEQIEAKLCAYLEGELDEQGRAEIEKHLAGNPAHRKLLAEVAGTRDLLRALPREAAPADLCETLQGHLERSVLLGDTAEDQVANRMRIFRWRPILAVAAMVVMAVGLGLVVYYGLPSATTHNHNAYTIGPSAQPSPTGDGRAATLPAEKPEEKNLAGDAEKKADGDAAENRLRYSFGERGARGSGGAVTEAGIAPVAAPRQSIASTTAPSGSQNLALAPAAAGQNVPESLPSLAQRVPRLWSPEQQREFFGAYARRNDGVPGGTNAAVYLVVSTPQPAAASDEIAQELDKLQVTWEAVQPQTVLASRQNAGAAGKAMADRLAAQDAETELQKKIQNGAAEPTPPVAPTAPAPATALDTAGGASSTAAAPADATRPRPAPAPLADKFAAAMPAPTSAPAGGERLILARNVTRRQAETLRANLTGRRQEQQVAVWSAQDGGQLGAKVAQINERPEAPVTEELAETAPPAGGAAGEPRAQVALRSAGAESEIQERSPAAGVGAAGGARGGRGTSVVAGGAPTPAQAGPPAEPSRRRMSDESFGEARAYEKDLSRPGAVAGTTAPSVRSKEDPAKRGLGREAETRQVRGRNAQPSARPESGRDEVAVVQTGRDSAAGGEASLKPAPAAPAAEAEAVKQKSESLTTSPATAKSATAPADADALGDADERIDLLIMVKGPEPAPSGPIEKFEFLTVTVGEDATNVQVSEDGTIDVQPVGKVKAEGLTTDALSRKLSESIAATRIDAKSVKVTRPGSEPPTSQPNENAEQKPAESGAQPSKGVAGESSPSSNEEPAKRPESSVEPQ